MAKKVYEEEKIRAIALKIREKAANNKTYTTEEMPSGIDDVYNEGYNYGYEDGDTDGFNRGYDRGHTAGVEAGKKSQYDEFWDGFQDKGERTDYINGFSGIGWSDKIFKPKYNITIKKEAFQTFRACRITDLVAALNTAGVTLDFGLATSFNATFHTSTITHLGIIDTRNAPTGTFAQTFYTCKQLKTIEKLILANGTQKFNSNAFQLCYELENITIEGTIGNSGLDFQWSTNLSKGSITSIINALSTSVSASSGYSITLSKTAVNKAFETSSGANNGYDSDEFRDLVLIRNNWNINLV